MNFQVNANITVFIEGINDCFSTQQVYVQWYTMVFVNGVWVVDTGKPAKIGVLAAAANTLSYTTWKAMNAIDQLTAIQTYISSQYQ